MKPFSCIIQNHLAAQILALNNQAVAAAAAVNAVAVSGPCKQRATALPNNFALAAAANSNNSNQNQHHQHHAAHQPSSINGLNYSMNDLINLGQIAGKTIWFFYFVSLSHKLCTSSGEGRVDVVFNIVCEKRARPAGPSIRGALTPEPYNY